MDSLPSHAPHLPPAGPQRSLRCKTTNEKCRKKPKTNNGNTVTTVADEEQTVGNSVISAVTPAPTYPFVEAFVMRILNRKDPVTELVREFRDEKRGNDFTKMTAFTANMEKNRYKDVGCLDNNRVALTIGPSTYIHGNFVSGGTDPKKFICTQAPLPTTIEDFWSMVLQEGCRCIVMLCNYMEKNVKKCAEYLPKSLAQPPDPAHDEDHHAGHWSLQVPVDDCYEDPED